MVVIVCDKSLGRQNDGGAVLFKFLPGVSIIEMKKMNFVITFLTQKEIISI
jgi:hypothetical protein